VLLPKPEKQQVLALALLIHTCLLAGTPVQILTREELLQRKHEEKTRSDMEAAKFLADYHAGIEADRAAEAARREKRLALKATHVKQAKAAMYRKARSKDEELQEQEMVRMKLMEEDLLFDKYSQALIAQYKAEGKNIKPLLLELAAMKAQGR
jgi:hypothetical protein